LPPDEAPSEPTEVPESPPEELPPEAALGYQRQRDDAARGLTISTSE
jgi:hypothetical protein